MTRYCVIAALVFTAIITIDKCIPLAIGCIALASVLSHVKASDTD